MSVSHGFDEYVRSLGVRDAATIPCTARSLTRDEAQIEDWKEISWKLFVVIGFGLFTLWIWWDSTEPDLGYWLAGGFAGLSAYVGFLIWQRLNKRRFYVNPLIEVEVTEASLDIRSPHGSSSQPYDQVVLLSMLSSSSGKSGRHFNGLVIKTPTGRIHLEDDWYLNGQAAAGAILKRLQELGLTGFPD